MRKIKAIFEAQHDIHMLNSWANFHALYGRFIKQEGEK